MSDDLPGVDLTAVDRPIDPTTLVAGRYRLDTPLASGGMATVWRGFDTVLARSVAVKVLHARLAADPEFVARFRREAIAAARLTHPNIVATYDTVDDPESIVMELIEGRTLRDELDRRGFLPVAEAIAITSDICQALEAAHQAGLVHRDIKPANVLLSSDGRVKVADFGIAKAAEGEMADIPDLTSIGAMVGTAKYLAPEQVSGGTVDSRTDVYAAGAVLYEMVCGRAPFSGENDLAVATARLRSAPERPRSILRTIPPRLDEIIMRALATEAGDRHPSASALWADLQSCPTADVTPPSSPGLADQTTIGTRPTFTRSERSWLVPTMLVSLVGAALVLAWVLIGGTEGPRDLFGLVDKVPGLRPGDDAQPLAVRVRSYDPAGDGEEHDELLAALIDDDPDTYWATERYGSRSFGGLKDGVGFTLAVEDMTIFDAIEVVSEHEGWNARIYVADGVADTIEGWGQPVATIDGYEPTGTITELDESGTAVLIWFTDLGDDDRVVLQIDDVELRGHRG